MLRALAPMVLALLVLSASLAPAMADPVEPIAERAQEKAAEAGDDPGGFAEDHATEEALAEEVSWTREYSCFAARETPKEAGQQPPDLSELGCPAFEEVREEDDLGLDDPDEAAAEPLGEVDGVVSDALGTADEVTKDPENAAQAVLGFLKRSVGAVGRVIGGAVDAVKALVDDMVLPMNQAAADGAKSLARLWVSMPVTATKWSIDQATSVQQAVLGGVQAAVKGVADGVKSAGQGIAGAVDSVGDSVRRTLEDWFSGTPETNVEDPVKRPTRELEETTDDLLPDLEDTLPQL